MSTFTTAQSAQLQTWISENRDDDSFVETLIVWVNDNTKKKRSKSPASMNMVECISWATTKPQEIVKLVGKTKGSQTKEKELYEKQWGNSMIGQVNNGQWTTKLGEEMVYTILKQRGENPRKVTTKNGWRPDWETDNYIYEVKTSNWWVNGTAGEKVLGTWIKYQQIPKLYGKPLKIVCIANQEYELEYGKTKYFGDNITPETKQVLDLAKSWDITYVRFSDMVHNFNN